MPNASYTRLLTSVLRSHQESVWGAPWNEEYPLPAFPSDAETRHVSYIVAPEDSYIVQYGPRRGQPTWLVGTMQLVADS